jgi:transposase-like protein
MNKEMLKEIMSNMDVVKELDEYGRNKLASLMEGLLIEIMGKERYEYLLENPKDKGNGSYKRSLNTSLGKLDLEVPRVRSGEFRSNLLPLKYQRYDESFEDLIFSFLINGDSKQEIIYKMKLRGLDFSEKAYDEIFEYIKNQFLEFKSKELQEDYYFVYIDAYHCMVKDKDKRVKKAVVYTVVGIDTNAQKSLLGYYSFFGSENKSTWMEVFQDLINRGLKRVLMFIADDFKGISDVIKAYFPYSDIQKCTVHLSRNIYKHMKKEDAFYVNKKLKEIKYSCDTYEKGLSIFQSDIIEKFKYQYPTYTKYLDSKKEEFLAFLKYPETIRKLINSTNTVESVHSSFVLGLTPCGVVALLGRKTKIKKRWFFSVYGYFKRSSFHCNRQIT